jgi:hypothetical protein
MTEVAWTEAIETLVKSLGEKALSMSWLHNRAEKRFAYFNNFLAIPSIIISTITGAGTIAFGSVGDVSYIMGALSIVVSILSTLNSYFAFAKRAEQHRLTAVNYSKLYLQVSIEMSLPRLKRMNVKSFLQTINEQIQRLNEVQPLIPDEIIKEYNIKFKDEPTTISKPEITNGLVSIQVFVDKEPEVKHSLVPLPTMIPPPPEISEQPKAKPWKS